jgi:hypothetical protein
MLGTEFAAGAKPYCARLFNAEGGTGASFFDPVDLELLEQLDSATTLAKVSATAPTDLRESLTVLFPFV